MAPENSSSAFLISVYNMRRACSGLVSYYAWASLKKGACLRPHISMGPDTGICSYQAVPSTVSFHGILIR
jgi:hypothetical protein